MTGIKLLGVVKSRNWYSDAPPWNADLLQLKIKNLGHSGFVFIEEDLRRKELEQMLSSTSEILFPSRADLPIEPGDAVVASYGFSDEKREVDEFASALVVLAGPRKYDAARVIARRVAQDNELKLDFKEPLPIRLKAVYFSYLNGKHPIISPEELVEMRQLLPLRWFT